MLMPKKVKYRKQQRGRMAGKAWRGSDVSFGDYGLKAMEPCWMTDRQIEAARIAMTRFIKRGGKIWIRVFPDKPITKKPQETRMGKGKGAPGAVGRGGQARPHPLRDGRRGRDGGATRDAAGGGEAARSRRSSRPGSRRRRRHEGRGTARTCRQTICAPRRRELDESLFRMRIQKSMGQLDVPLKLRTQRRDLARVKTVLRQKQA